MQAEDDPAAGRPAGSYWEETAPPLAAEVPVLSRSERCEVAVVGAGYTGLSTAMHLALGYGADVCLVDAAAPGWGASGRNGGWVCMGASRLSWGALIRRHGLEDARRYYAIQRDAIGVVRRLCTDLEIEAEQTGNGLITLAHRRRRAEALREEVGFMRENFGEKRIFFPREALRDRGWEGPEFHAALLEPHGFGLHPLRYLRGLAQAAAGAGVRLRSASPVVDWQRRDGSHVLVTPGGKIACRHVVFATNGYTPEALIAPLDGRLLPVVSTVLVTRVLTEDELAAQGWTSHVPSADSRTLLHYFRLLPEGRFLFGGRGTAKGTEKGEAEARSLLRADFERLFPAWKAVETTHTWQGNICTVATGTPFIGPLDREQTVWAALGYHGNGVAMGTWAGRALAGMISGDPVALALPAFLRRPPRRYPVPALRRLYLRAAYLVYGIGDRLL